MAPKPVMVKWTVDLYAPGAIITPHLVKWLAEAKMFHSRRSLFPADVALRDVLDVQQDGAKVLNDFAHVRVSSIMDDWDGILDGDVDHLLTLKSLGEVFDLARVTGMALAIAPAYRTGITKAGWVELHEVDAEEETVTFVKLLSIVEIFKNIVQRGE